MSIIAEALDKAQKSSWKPNHSSAKKAPDRKPAAKRPAAVSFPKRFVIVLSGFFFIALGYFLWQITAENPLSPPNGAVIPGNKTENTVKKTPVAASLPAPVSRDETVKTIELTGIMYNPEAPRAVINGSIWGEGEYIGEFEILEIGKDFLRVASGGRESTLKLKR